MGRKCDGCVPRARSLWDTLAGFADGGDHGRTELKDSDQISEDSTRKNLGFCYRGGFVFDFSCLLRLDGTEEWRALIELPRPRYACVLSLPSYLDIPARGS